MRETSPITGPSVAVATGSDVGRVRATNEDRVFADPERGGFAVIDGVGGQAAGELAAQTALDTIRQRLQLQIGTPAERVREAIALANDRIHQDAQEHPDRRGMACVLTLVLLQNGTLTAGHVGDTRLYKLRGGVLRKLTHDHSPIGEREDRGELTESEAMRHPRRNEVYREVGAEPHGPDDEGFIELIEEPFEPDAALVLCSDGLSDALSSAAITTIVERHAGDPVEVVDRLIERANDVGGKDNVSVVYIEGRAFAPAARQVGGVSGRAGTGESPSGSNRSVNGLPSASVGSGTPVGTLPSTGASRSGASSVAGGSERTSEDGARGRSGADRGTRGSGEGTGWDVWSRGGTDDRGGAGEGTSTSGRGSATTGSARDAVGPDANQSTRGGTGTSAASSGARDVVAGTGPSTRGAGTPPARGSGARDAAGSGANPSVRGSTAASPASAGARDAAARGTNALERDTATGRASASASADAVSSRRGAARVLPFVLGLLTGVAIALGVAYTMRDALFPQGSQTTSGPRAISVGSAAGAQFETIGEALAVARPGDTIRVGPGEYREQIVVQDGVTVLATPARAAVLRPPAQAPQPWTAVIVTGVQHGSRVSGLTIAGGPQSPIAIGVHVLGRTAIDDLDVSGTSVAGIALDGGTLSMTATAIRDNAGVGVALNGGEARLAHNVIARNGSPNAAPPAAVDVVLTNAPQVTLVNNVLGGDPAQRVRGLPADQLARVRETNIVLPSASAPSSSSSVPNAPARAGTTRRATR